MSYTTYPLRFNKLSDFEKSLHRKIKIEAFRRNQSMNDFILKTMKKAIETDEQQRQQKAG